MKAFFQATAAMIGMIVGVGIFAVPYVSAQAGFLVGLFWIVLLGLVSLFINLLFGELVAGTTGKHRLAGYAQRYLGRPAKSIVTISQTIAFWGAQLAYLIVGGTFLRILLNGYDGGSVMGYSLWLFAFVAIVTFFGLRIFGKIEFYLTWVLIAVIGVIFFAGVPNVDPSNFIGGDIAKIFLPYGVILFALGGSPAIPEMWDIVHGKKRALRAAIIAGTLISVLITLLFMLVVVGISGSATSQEAFVGLRGALPPFIIWLGALFGFLAVITSYLVIAMYLKELFQYDFRLKLFPAWLFAVWVPLILYFGGAQNFVRVLDIVGSVFGGFDALMIVLVSLAYAYRRHAPRKKLKTALGAIIMVLLAIGVIQKLLNIL
ncbi:hypothetical protein A3B21_00640 [Candidatus Uhrbacteria bacterium RIFCSPLOWO2_01_FULL_47_24]|uniref:Amino acid transporter transmembrane domain-containing protein n=1 Tax=Candidatus Uhrbacteria bacterium RIFCSPLOWO2_01_FULL_47_24 TaxID=1802401 RepID=A0A1F7UQ69_9BACT|nr:MAG: hypothetical protein A2753_04810 [Candidatus Uhrbacteria bacterium RIFCSPHIGHO2_01_FULL_47_11]OGL67679.1 MAG: hypothetical protein A3D58_04530 [Candidatus Uhrbacteria bacterium RIFCSPHIGHO2_02_FULL_46_47]OGL74862.1 MAG: hypothetical protein A3F52_00295 [Candidatus Uhrbacteria bacterium RIFCSPHIGHO2_12_FULL_47_11]OGL79884.1 MAG: hypothetical protein A3B21_00640 [Candidatus Uhrbacteria bacterium RIFCSPLOWO2_01_FULL_47_24]OGL84104.1 MAG: hypothetical protein A3J03_03435 [Candidatus Uhrbact